MYPVNPETNKASDHTDFGLSYEGSSVYNVTVFNLDTFVACGRISISLSNVYNISEFLKAFLTVTRPVKIQMRLRACKFCPFIVDPNFEEEYVYREINRKSQLLPSFERITKILPFVLILLKDYIIGYLMHIFSYL